MEYPGILKKQHGISRGDQEKVMCNFQGSWFQGCLKFQRGLTQLGGVASGEALLCLEFLGIKVKQPKN